MFGCSTGYFDNNLSPSGHVSKSIIPTPWTKVLPCRVENYIHSSQWLELDYTVPASVLECSCCKSKWITSIILIQTDKM